MAELNVFSALRVDRTESTSNGADSSFASFGLTGLEAEAIDWSSKGLCAGEDVDPEWWFVESQPGKGLDPSSSVARPDRMAESTKQVLRAQMICRRCPVRRECLNYAMENGEALGIWGATTPRMRARMGGWMTRHVDHTGRVPENYRLKKDWDGWTWNDEAPEVTQEPVVEQGRIVPGAGSRRPEGKCLSGRHDWIPENLCSDGRGGWACRLCHNISQAASKRRKREERLARGIRFNWPLTEFTAEYNRMSLGTLDAAEAASIMGMKKDTYLRAVQRMRKAQASDRGNAGE